MHLVPSVTCCIIIFYDKLKKSASESDRSQVVCMTSVLHDIRIWWISTLKNSHLLFLLFSYFFFSLLFSLQTKLVLKGSICSFHLYLKCHFTALSSSCSLHPELRRIKRSTSCWPAEEENNTLTTQNYGFMPPVDLLHVLLDVSRLCGSFMCCCASFYLVLIMFISRPVRSVHTCRACVSLRFCVFMLI